jgi:membrane protease subunit (stomatin/prohibitin family)
MGLFGRHIPQEGWSVKVIYDPSDHSRVVIDLDEMFVRPGVADRDAAVARHERALAMSRAGVSPDLLAMQQQMASKFLAGREAGAGQATAPAPDVADELGKLADLRDRGVLTDAEFQQQKAKFLGNA